jgi:hypothetical protein
MTKPRYLRYLRVNQIKRLAEILCLLIILLMDRHSTNKQKRDGCRGACRIVPLTLLHYPDCSPTIKLLDLTGLLSVFLCQSGSDQVF